MAQILVQKYGGTSLGDLAKLDMVAKRIHTSLNCNSKVVVVVSAMGSFTDELIAMANSIHTAPPKRELDMLVTTGERISSSLLCIALNHLGVSAISLTGSQCGILTDETHGNARIQKIKGNRMRACLETHQVVIVAGFQGVSPSTKDITSLGRGGSDLTAVALAIALNADFCEINTDVDGVFTSDPRMVAKPKLINKLSWDEMLEMSWAGAGVLHHRAAFLAKKYQLPIVIRSAQEKSDKKTLIEGSKSVEESFVTTIASKRKQIFLEYVQECGESVGTSGDAADVTRDYLWSIDESPLIFQVAYRGTQLHVLLVLSEQHLQSLLDELSVKGLKLEVKRRDAVSSISIIGGGFKQNPEVVKGAFSCLKKPFYFSEIKDPSITFVIDPHDLESCLHALHGHCFASRSIDVKPPTL
ncbi:MAG: aspartate kinase [Oligoflexales bacterium]